MHETKRASKEAIVAALQQVSGKLFWLGDRCGVSILLDDAQAEDFLDILIGPEDEN